MAARTTTAGDFEVHAACLFDLADVGLLPPPAEGNALDLSDTTVRRLAVGASVFSVACALGGLWLAAVVG